MLFYIFKMNNMSCCGECGGEAPKEEKVIEQDQALETEASVEE